MFSIRSFAAAAGTYTSSQKTVFIETIIRSGKSKYLVLWQKLETLTLSNVREVDKIKTRCCPWIFLYYFEITSQLSYETIKHSNIFRN